MAMMVEVANVAVDVQSIRAVRVVPDWFIAPAVNPRVTVEVLFNDSGWVTLGNYAEDIARQVARRLVAEKEWPVGSEVVWDGTAAGATRIIDMVLSLGEHRDDGPVVSYDDSGDRPRLWVTNPDGTEYIVTARNGLIRKFPEVFTRHP